MNTIDRDETRAAWRRANNRGDGFPPEGETITETLKAYVKRGGEILLERRTSDEIAVVRLGGRLIGIGGDASGANPWACRLPTEDTVQGRTFADWLRDADREDSTSEHDLRAAWRAGESPDAYR